MQTQQKIQWVAGAVLIVLVSIYGLSSVRRTPERPSGAKIEHVFNELSVSDVWVGWLVPDASGSTLAYVIGTEKGRRVCLLDLKTLEKRFIPGETEATYIGGWSPDDRLLVYAQVAPSPPANTNSKPADPGWQMMVYDRQIGNVRRLTDTTNVSEVLFYWLSNGDYLLVRYDLPKGRSESFLGNPSRLNQEKVSVQVPAFAIMSDNRGVYTASNELWTLELKSQKKTESGGWDEKSRTVQQVSDFKTNGFTGFNWVRYAAGTSNFLFCATPAGSDIRHAYRYDPTARLLTQLSREDTYNCQFLQDGRGFAYVINTNNSFHLAVRPEDPAGNTNLFTSGSLLAYKVSSQGTELYSWASTGHEPRGIWEYSLTNRVLRKVAYGVERELLHSQIVQPEEFMLKSFDNLEVPCFLFPPAQIAKGKETSKAGFFEGLRPPKKYPVIIYVPPPSLQFQRGFNSQAQVFANLGFYFAAINYRGCDGYGAKYSKLASTQDAARDVLMLRERLIKNPNVDAENIFLTTTSGGMAVVTELMATKPNYWRGAGLNTPGSVNIDKRFQPGKLPPMVMIMGGQDGALDSMKAFASWAATNAVELKTVIHTNAGHVAYSLDDRTDAQRQMVDFFLSHLK